MGNARRVYVQVEYTRKHVTALFGLVLRKNELENIFSIFFSMTLNRNYIEQEIL